MLNILIPQVDFYTRVIVGILGVAFPILFQLIARLDEKYSSTLIVEMFNKELENIWFIRSLIISMLATGIWTFQFTALFHTEISWIDFLIDNSADLLVCICTSISVLLFFFYVKKIFIYYTPSEFISYLQTKHLKNSDKLIYFEALGDVFAHSIRKANYKLTETIHRFFGDEYRRVRDQHKNAPVVYPDIYYRIIYTSIEELVSQNAKRNTALEYAIAGHGLLVGDPAKNEISEQTYTKIWANILLCIRFKNDEMIIHYWEHAHQNAHLNLNSYSNIDAEAKKRRQRIKERFLEFHLLVCALLLYTKRYECLSRILRHTTSEPPSYDLLPHGPDRIFRNFAKFIDPYDREYAFISFKYPFPDTNGINADGLIKKWICSYISLIFLKQYTLNSYFTYDNHLGLPNSPGTQSEKRFWIDNLDYFLRLVKENIENAELQKIIKYDFITDEWCKNNGLLTPTDYIIKLRAKLETDFAAKEVNQELLPEKVALFEKTSKENIKASFAEIKKVNNQKAIGGPFKFWLISGQSTFGSKDSFAGDAPVAYLNFDSALSEALSREIRDKFSQTFSAISKNRYVLKREDVFKAIDNMKLNENYTLVSFGFHLQHYIEFLKIAHLTLERYNSTPIISFPFRVHGENAIFILKTDDLPRIKSRNVDEKILQDYKLKQIADEPLLFSSVLDLNKESDAFLKEYFPGQERSRLNKSVLISLIYDIEIQWESDAQVIQIQEFSEYLDQGIPNSVADVIGFTKE